MSAWIGPMGTLIPFKCPSAVESSNEDPHVYFRSLGGSIGVTRLGDPTRPRAWNVSVSAARPHDVAALQGFADGEWGPGPFVFIPPAAETLNLLSKRDALCMGVGSSYASYVAQRPGTPVVTTEGVAGASYTAITLTPADGFMGNAPVIPGTPVTVRAWVHATPEKAARIFARFYTAGGTQVGATPVISTSSTAGEFLHSTAVAPATAAYCSLFACGAIIARLQCTWTDGPRTWSPSAASQNVVISPLSNSVRRATGVAGEEQITDHSFTVQELSA